VSRNPSLYRIDGRRVPSVTEVLRIAGLVDLSAIQRDVLETARQRGQSVHTWIDGMNRGLLDGTPQEEEIAGYVEGYRKFLVDARVTVEGSEVQVVSAVYGFAGRLDLLASLNGDPWLIDVKATAAVPKEACIQTAGYRIAHGEKRKRGVLHLHRDGGFALVAHRNDREDEHDFLACLRLVYLKLRLGLAALED